MAAVYGTPGYVPIDEAPPKHTISPEGRSNLLLGPVLEYFDRAYGFENVGVGKTTN